MISVVEPATAQVMAEVPRAGADEVDAAVERAREAFPARRLVHVPPGRFAETGEIAQAALFLATEESSCVNATSFMVDGGLSGAYVTPE